MHIVCPHCTTSYAINPATLGPAGRTVRCSRCKETWLARSEDAIEMADAMPAAMPSQAQSAPLAADDAAVRQLLDRMGVRWRLVQAVFRPARFATDLKGQSTGFITQGHVHSLTPISGV